MATLRLFASAREAAGVAKVEIEASSVEELLAVATSRFGQQFVDVVSISRVWVNGGPAEPNTLISNHDVVAVLPPVSGGSRVRADVVEEPLYDVPSYEALALEAATRPHLKLIRTEDDGARGDGNGRHLAAGRRPRSTASQTSRRATITAPISHDALARSLPARSTPLPDAPPEIEREPLAEARPKPRTGRRSRTRQPLAVIQSSTRPHGRLGLAWAAITIPALLAGPTTLAVWLGVGSGLAAVQVIRTWGGRHQRVLRLPTILTAVALPFAAAWGLSAVGVVAALAVVAMVTSRLLVPIPGQANDRGRVNDIVRALFVGVGIGLAAAAPVYLRTLNLAAPIFLLACAAAYDTGAYLVGTGARSIWEGPAGGIAALVPLTLMATVALQPPFDGAAPVLLGLLAAILAPMGPVAASAMLGDRNVTAPALRRLDSLLVMGPLWCLAAIHAL